jgi:hypothetical protein
LGWGFVFVVAERAAVEDAVGFLVVGYGGAAEVDGGFGSSGGQLGSIFVQVVEVVLARVSYCVMYERVEVTYIEL